MDGPRRFQGSEIAYTPLASLLAWSRDSIALGSSCNCAAAINVFSCAELVALAMGAVMLGRAINHAKATDAGVL